MKSSSSTPPTSVYRAAIGAKASRATGARSATPLTGVYRAAIGAALPDELRSPEYGAAAGALAVTVLGSGPLQFRWPTGFAYTP